MTVFTDDQAIKEGLTDPRFIHSDDPNAQVVWPTGLDRPALKAKAIENGSYFNSFPFDEVILLRDLLVQMVNNVVRHSENTDQVIPESFIVAHQLPAFVGRFIEREDGF